MGRTLFSRDEYGYVKEVDCWNEDEESEDSGEDAEKIPQKDDNSEKIPVITSTLDEKEVTRLAMILWEKAQEDNLKYSYDREGVFLITFDGYYRKDSDRKHGGGYGAMLWSGGNDGGPLAAVAGSSPHRVSTFYHNLEGLLSGLDLANDFPDIESVFMVCNSDRVWLAVLECFITNIEGHCRRHPSEDCKNFCVPCLQGKLSKDESLPPVIDIMTRIMNTGKRFYRRSPWVVAHKKEWNKPADYLAKMSKTAELPGQKRFVPNEFPDDLKALVGEFGGQSPFIIQ